MKIHATYRRTIRTSRRLVFENIFDLEHVCVLHRRWFRNLRICVQRPDFVEYRLTSLFYGLAQETLVRGAQIDESHYWYEFITPLASLRVDGVMEGTDGSLVLTEMISSDFHWTLAPVLWLLQPLFRRQKEDILLADTKLLERVYELEQTGFQRHEARRETVVVYGGEGFFGRFVVEDLLKYSNARIVIASRNPKGENFQSYSPRVQFVISDVHDYQSVLQTIAGARVAICCTGPFQGMKATLLRGCIEKKVHYVDIADDRAYVEACFALRQEIEQAGIVALPGCSVVPGLSTLLTAYLCEDLNTLEKARICISPGTRNPRGPGSFACLLATVGTDYRVPQNGGSRTVLGWTERERVRFPDPMGWRSVYSVVDIPDYFLQSYYFGTPTVEFKIGSELELLNRSLSMVRSGKQVIGANLGPAFLSLARLFIRSTALFGTSQGGVMVRVSGRSSDGAKREKALCVFASAKGEVIPAVLPALAARMILAGELNRPGVADHTKWISMQRVLQEFDKRNIQVAFRDNEDTEWRRFPAPASH